MIRRDDFGIICQHDLNVPDYMDGGDSASRTGIMALSGSTQDIQLMQSFVLEDGLIRHPHQPPAWNDPKKTSRDQLVCFVAGLFNKNQFLANRLRLLYTFFINKDILMPDVRNHLRLCSGLPGTILGYMYLNISIAWAAYVRPGDELNQLVCMCIVAGPKYCQKLLKRHPNVEKNLMDYWSGWRDQSEIGIALFNRLIHESRL